MTAMEPRCFERRRADENSSELFRTILESLVTKRVNDVHDDSRLPKNISLLHSIVRSGVEWNGVARRNDRCSQSCVFPVDARDAVGSILLSRNWLTRESFS